MTLAINPVDEVRARPGLAPGSVRRAQAARARRESRTAFRYRVERTRGRPGDTSAGARAPMRARSGSSRTAIGARLRSPDAGAALRRPVPDSHPHLPPFWAGTEPTYQGGTAFTLGRTGDLPGGTGDLPGRAGGLTQLAQPERLASQ